MIESWQLWLLFGFNCRSADLDEDEEDRRTGKKIHIEILLMLTEIKRGYGKFKMASYSTKGGVN